MELAPVVLFVFNRPWHTRQTLEALQNNTLSGKSDLIIFSDGAKTIEDETKVRAVRDYIKTIDGFKNLSIFERDRNHGLAESIISGVSEIVIKYGKIIVLEDDLVSSANFLQFMNQALTTYEKKKNIFSVTGYNFLSKIPDGYKEQVFLSYRPSSWGWGTWADRWIKADWEVKDFKQFVMNKRDHARFNRGGEDLTGMLIQQMKGKLDSWGIRWCYTHFKHDAYCLVPVTSKITNIGFDNSGTHCGASGKYDVPLDDCSAEIKLPGEIYVNEDIVNASADFHRKTLLQRIISAIGIWN